MSNFWATALGAVAPAPAPAPAPAAPAFQPWWGTPQVAPPAPVAQPQPLPEPAGPQGWGDEEKSRRKAMSSRSTDTCPSCGTANYFKPLGLPNAMVKCYECGYNPRFSQTGGEGGLPSGAAGSTAATPSRQTVAGGLGGASNYHPEIVVGKA